MNCIGGKNPEGRDKIVMGVVVLRGRMGLRANALGGKLVGG